MSVALATEKNLALKPKGIRLCIPALGFYLSPVSPYIYVCVKQPLNLIQAVNLMCSGSSTARNTGFLDILMKNVIDQRSNTA